MKPKVNRAGSLEESRPFDRCQTPDYALDPILPFLRPGWRIWEPAAGEGNIARVLRREGWEVEESDLLTGHNFFTHEPAGAWDAIVTNPPYSVKPQWLERCYQLGRPFALLVPVEMLGTVSAQRPMFAHGVEVMLLDKRVNFKMPEKGYSASGAQFPVMWLTWGLGLGSQLAWGHIERRENGAPRPALLSAPPPAVAAPPPTPSRMSQAMQLMTSQSTDEWYTPGWVIELARAVLGGIDLDPASNATAQRTVQAARYFTAAEDGYSRPWAGRVWLNPPFSEAPRWARRLAAAVADGDVSAACMLVNSAPGYTWYEELVDHWPALQFRKRLAFVRPDGTAAGLAKKSQTVFYFGPDVDRFAETFGPYGRMLRTTAPAPAGWLDQIERAA